MTIPSDFKNIRFEEAEGIGTLTFNRPDKLNALNSEVLTEVKTLLESLNNKGICLKGLIVTGEGEKAFVAGADIAEMSDMNPDQGRAFGKLGQDVTLLFEQLPFPVVAAVNGFALGGGCEMAMSADIILATDNAVFGQPEVKLGLIPGYGGTQRLAKLVGRQRAKELIYTGRNLVAAEALEWGLVLTLLPNKEALIDAAKDFILKVNKNSPLAISLAKKVMNAGNDLTVTEGLGLELDQFSAIFSSEDLREGTKAFVEKRKPQFIGK